MSGVGAGCLKNCIDILVTNVSKGRVFRVCWIYGNPVFEDRKVLWEQIKKITNIFKMPWMYIGDFIDVKDIIEKDG